MNDELFAEMFERYVKSSRGTAFLNKYLTAALSYAEVNCEDNVGNVQLNATSYVDEKVCEALNR